MKRHLFATGKGRDREDMCWCGEPKHKGGDFAHCKNLEDGSIIGDLYLDITLPIVKVEFTIDGLSEEQSDGLEETIKRINDANEI